MHIMQDKQDVHIIKVGRKVISDLESNPPKNYSDMTIQKEIYVSGGCGAQLVTKIRHELCSSGRRTGLQQMLQV